MKTITVLALAVILSASASALLVNDAQTWIGRPNDPMVAEEIKLVDAPISSVLDIGPSGILTVNNSGTSTKNGRLTFDHNSKLTVNGGVLYSNSNMAFTGGTSTVGTMSEIIINSGTVRANVIELTATPTGNWTGKLGRYGKITLAEPGSVLRVLTGYTEGVALTYSTADRYNPWVWVEAGTLVAGAGYSLKFTDLGPTENFGGMAQRAGTRAVEVTVIPEPATLSLLGLGALAMLRKRK